MVRFSKRIKDILSKNSYPHNVLDNIIKYNVNRFVCNQPFISNYHT